jgi:hypothetical protein
MNVKTIVGALAAVFLLPLVGQAEPADTARLPYRQLYEIQKLEGELSHTYTNLEAVLTMQSTRTNVTSKDVQAYIDARSGKIPVKIGPVGDFVVPMSQDLLAQDPWLVTNQPHGTMKLNWLAGFTGLKVTTKSLQYAQLMQPVRDCDDLKAQMRRVFPGLPQLTTTGLKLIFPATAKKAWAVIHSQSGARKLTANEKNEVFVPMAADLLEENPVISMSDVPGTVELASHKEQD